MNKLFEILATSEVANRQALDSIGRQSYPIKAVVTNNNDPKSQRRIKVSDPAVPSLSSYWFRRLASSPFKDEPLPPVGSTVYVFFADGDPSDGFYLPLVNNTNPPLDKGDAINDHYEEIPGDRNIFVAGKFTLKNEAGIKVHGSDDGTYSIENASSTKITIQPSGAIEIDASGNTFSITNASDATIEGKSVATIGAVDTSGDALITRGW
ncbi:MAG: phage baseplate assembly protein V [Elainellaceae cyanobacterium]